MHRSVIIIGAGGLGQQIAAAARIRGCRWRITLVDRDRERVDEAVAGLRALAVAPSPHVEGVALDALDEQGLRSLIEASRADAVVNVATLLPVERWWAIAGRHDVGRGFNELGFGPWLALHLVIASAVASAVGASEPRPLFMNAAYPDAINALLARWHGFAPAGAGNIRLLEPGLRTELSERAGSAGDDLEIALSAHYVHVRNLLMREPELPQGWRLSITGQGAPEGLDADEQRALLRRAGAAVPRGAASHTWTATSIVEDLETLLGQGPARRSLMAGPLGMVGGYPVELAEGSVRLALPEDWDEGELAAEQRRAARLDGIGGIDPRGAVEFSPSARDLYQGITGAALEPVTRENVADVARSQLEILRKL
jgi:hypothetical protein